MNPGLILGYHGCSASLARAVLSGKERHLMPSTSELEWLGDGVYCWEDSYSRALEWAKQRLPRGRKPAVVGVLIKPGNCLDLLDSVEIDMLKDFAANMERLYKRAGLTLPINKDLCHRYDCMLINRYLKYVREERGRSYDTVRAAFMEGGRINEAGHSALFERAHIQWAICNVESIIGYFRPVPVETR